jgi:hypothetical protein
MPFRARQSHIEQAIRVVEPEHQAEHVRELRAVVGNRLTITILDHDGAVDEIAMEGIYRCLERYRRRKQAEASAALQMERERNRPMLSLHKRDLSGSGA